MKEDEKSDMQLAVEGEHGADALLPLHRGEGVVHVVQWDLAVTRAAASNSPASQRSTSSGTCDLPLTPPNEEPATRRPVIRRRGTMSSVSPLPATPIIVARPHASRAASTACCITCNVSGRLERVVGAEAAGLRSDPLDRLVVGDARIRCAVSPRFGESAIREVDGDDPLCTREPAADHRAEPDEATAEDDARRAGFGLGRVERRPEPSREAARKRRAAVEWRLRIDLRQRDLRHHRVLRERRGAHEVPERPAVTDKTRRAVG